MQMTLLALLNHYTSTTPAFIEFKPNLGNVPHTSLNFSINENDLYLLKGYVSNHGRHMVPVSRIKQ